MILSGFSKFHEIKVLHSKKVLWTQKQMKNSYNNLILWTTDVHCHPWDV